MREIKVKAPMYLVLPAVLPTPQTEQESVVVFQYDKALKQLAKDFIEDDHYEIHGHYGHYQIQFIANGEVEDLPNSIELEIRATCCQDFQKKIERMFDDKKLEWIMNQSI